GDDRCMPGWRIVDRRHPRQAGRLCALKRNVERHGPGTTGGARADAHLDADDDIAIGVSDLGCIERRHQAEFLALAYHDARRGGENAGERNMEIREDAHLAAFDHMFAESRKVTGPRATGIDRSSDAGTAAKIFGVDAERGAAPVDVGVQVDEARGDDKAGYIADVGFAIGAERGADARPPAARESDVSHRVELLRWIDDAAAAQDEVIDHRRILHARRASSPLVL